MIDPPGAAGSGATHLVGPEAPRARLVLEDGRTFWGRAFGDRRSASGEVVFTTGMVGYPESLTDPSYRGQILTMTYPLVGNYGVPAGGVCDGLPLALESERIHARGLVVSTISHDYSHWQAARSLSEWLATEGVVGIEGVDTRALTRHLRHRGCVSGKILVEGDAAAETLASGPFEEISLRNLVAEVSVPEPVLLGSGRRRVVLVDCGAKANIVRSLLARGVSVLRVPWDHDLASADGDGILVSNGPGDPQQAQATVEQLRAALEARRPVFGICLGNQLLGRAIGLDTYKLKFGHRSQNQPCVEVGTRRCTITSQNHGYALDTSGLRDGGPVEDGPVEDGPVEDWEEWFVNANDGTNEGIRHRSLPQASVQFHPEATPGPRDSAALFDRFLENLG